MSRPADRPDEAGEELRAALRDLLPDYRGPADPFVRVGAAVRRRRRVVRARLAAVGAAAAAAAAAVVVPATLVSGPAGTPPAAPRPPGPPQDPAAVQPVARGTVGGLTWAFGSTALSADETPCLYGDGGALDRTVACFPSWDPSRDASWAEVPVRGGTARTATAVLGVVPAGIPGATVVLRDGAEVRVTAVRTSTDPRARFLAVVVPGTRDVREVVLLDAAGTPVSTDDDPDAQPCDAPGTGCAEPVN